jgi:site-specific recombinase XerD
MQSKERSIAIMSTIKMSADMTRQIVAYREFMTEHEYTSQTTQGYSTYVSRFLRSSFSGKEELPLRECIEGFLKKERDHNPKTFKECRAALYLYFKMVKGTGFPKRNTKVSGPDIDYLLQRFYDFSVNFKRIKQTSADWEVSQVRRFLEYSVNEKNQHPESVTALEIREYLLNRFKHLSDSSKGHEATAIRNLYRFLRFEGANIHESVFRLPLSPAVWKKSAFPKTMDEKIFDSLYKIPDSGTHTGKRDICIILCFTELALRCQEVASLTIDDFNWREGSVTIRNAKNHFDRRLPLSKKLAEAIIRYLKESRPRTNSRVLFVRFSHTCGIPMGCSQIRGVVRRIYKKTGASEKETSTGTHILRRTAATKIYNMGNSLKQTADILGHKSLDSTVFYTKADISRLRQTALPWPKTLEKAGVRNEK